MLLPTACSAAPHPLHPRSHTPFPKLELGLGSRPAAPRELPACSICLERLREPISLDCGHDFCTRCFSTHRVPGCQPACCPECRKICKQKKGLRSLGEKMKLLPQRPLPAVLQVGARASALGPLGRGELEGPGSDPRGAQQLWLYSGMSGWGTESGVGCAPHLAAQGTFLLPTQETCAVRAEPLLLVRINTSGGLILRMGAINRCLKHPLARDTPVCLLAVLGEQHSGKTFLLNHLLRGLPSLVREGLGQGGSLGVPAWNWEGNGGWMDQRMLSFSALQESGGGGWPRGGGSLQGFRWGANSLTRGIWMWSHPFLLGKEGRKVRGMKGTGGEDCGAGEERVKRFGGMGRSLTKGRGMEKASFGGRYRKMRWTREGWGSTWWSEAGLTPRFISPPPPPPVQVAVFLVDTGDAMSPELSRETRTKLCALTTMLSSYQVRAL